MRIVLITRENPEHLYVANTLCARVAISAVIFDRGRKQSISRRIKALVARYSIVEIVSRSIGKVLAVVLQDRARQQQEFRRIFGLVNIGHPLGDVPIIPVHGVNTHPSITKLKELNPDLLLIYGTGIIGKTVLGIPTLGALNMHTGISPYYRGADCAFWPLYHGELHRLGATVHDCTAEVDGGSIHAVKTADLRGDDNYFSVFPKCVRAGAEIYVEVVQDFIRANTRLPGTKQDFKLGIEYKSVMKSWRKELLVRWKIRKGLIRRYVEGSQLRQDLLVRDQGAGWK